jgi:hypothetical protein
MTQGFDPDQPEKSINMEPLPIELKWQLEARAAQLSITPEKYLQLLIEKELDNAL